MAEKLDGEEVHRGSKLRIGILASVEVGGCSERIDQDECGFGHVVGVRHLVACSCIEVRNGDGLGV